MKEKIEQIQEFLSSHTVDEIMKINLLKFFNLEDKYTLDELEKKYTKEQFNEINQPIEYFKSSISDIKYNIEKYIWVYNTLLTEERSKNVFVNMLYAKIFMSLKSIEDAYSDELIYFDKTIWGELSNETYVDCGGYIGDTALQFISKCLDYKKVFIYEPLSQLAEICENNLSYFIREGSLTVHNNAVYKEREELHFAQELGHGDSCIKEEGELIVQAISLDEEIKERISFIKMDIEGSEKNAILGVRDHIKNDNPKMAICIYHLVDDFWKIPEMIYNINSNYDFIVRQHLINGFAETVLYCIPKIEEKNVKINTKDDGIYFQRCKHILEVSDIYIESEKIDMLQMMKGKNWFLAQLRNYFHSVRNKEREIEELIKWAKELENGKLYLEGQISNYKSRVDELEDWIVKLQEAKDYLENEYNRINIENERTSDSVNELEKEVAELKNKNSKLQYKFNKVVNDTLIRKIIKWKKYDIL